MVIKEDQNMTVNYSYTVDIDPKELTKHVRHYIYQYSIFYSKAPNLEEIMRTFEITKEESIKILEKLEEQHHIKLIPKVPRILMAWPFSNIPTQYQVSTLQGKTYFANCAWDAIAFHIVLNQDIKISSFCYHCGQPVRISVSKSSLIVKNPESAIINFSLPIAHWMEDVIETCGNTMNFFSSDQHLKDWKEKNPNKASHTFTDDQIIALTKLIYTKRAELDYKRPNTEEIKQLLESVDLIGEFWKVDEYH
ncbi:MAG: Alkylmercury lyase [Candidatus Heimdallarchaeota archaeon LC_3]|nr:MAG: Alkylmercury lyase [Candidatus Heimdallarchaeota archaeon LC_3]